MSQEAPVHEEIDAFGLLERLLAECGKAQKDLSGCIHRLEVVRRQLASPHLPDVPLQLPFKVEMWDRQEDHIQWVVAVASTVTIAHGAFDAAVSSYPDYRWMLRNGILVIRRYP